MWLARGLSKGCRIGFSWGLGDRFTKRMCRRSKSDGFFHQGILALSRSSQVGGTSTIWVSSAHQHFHGSCPRHFAPSPFCNLGAGHGSCCLHKLSECHAIFQVLVLERQCLLTSHRVPDFTRSRDEGLRTGCRHGRLYRYRNS